MSKDIKEVKLAQKKNAKMMLIHSDGNFKKKN